MNSLKKPAASLRMLFALLTGSFSTAVLTDAQVLSNGTGGGNWNSASTWSDGVVPANTQSWTIRAGDTVTAGSGVNYLSTSQNPVVQGKLIVNPGASFQVHRLNSTATTGSGTVYLSGGTFTAARLGGNVTMTFNLTSGGTLRVNDSSAISARYAINVGNGGTFMTNAAFFSGAQLNLATGGTIVQTPGMVSSVLTNAAVTWNGGTLITNTTSFTYSGNVLTKLLATWSGHAENILALSSQAAAQTLNFGANTGMITKGKLVFTVYGPANDNNDKLIQADNTSTSLSPGVRLVIDNPGGVGPASEYVGKRYQLFTTSGDGSYEAINPTLEPTVWNIGGVDHAVTWTNTLSTNGMLTVAALKPAAPVRVSHLDRAPKTSVAQLHRTLRLNNRPISGNADH
jgi:hypothetical protein